MFAGAALFHIKPGRPALHSSRPTIITHAYSLLRCNMADSSLLQRGVLHQRTAADLLGDLVLSDISIYFLSQLRDRKKWGFLKVVFEIKTNACVQCCSGRALTGSSGFWLTSWRGSSGRWSRRIRVNSLMNTASPSFARTATWKTKDPVRGVLQVDANQLQTNATAF